MGSARKRHNMLRLQDVGKADPFGIPGPSPSKTGKSWKNRESPKKDRGVSISKEHEIPPAWEEEHENVPSNHSGNFDSGPKTPGGS